MPCVDLIGEAATCAVLGSCWDPSLTIAAAPPSVEGIVQVHESALR